MWKATSLGDICRMYQPQTISKKEMKSDGKYFVYGANGIIGKYNKYNHSEPQLLITCRGATCGSINISKPFSWINGNAMVIQPDTSVVSLKFMEYVFRGGINLSKVITGSAQPQITRESLNSITFFYPPLIEQQRIVAKLDAAFAEIDKEVEISNKTINLSKTNLKKIIDEKTRGNDNWVEFKVKNLGIVKTGSTPKTSQKENYGTEIPFVKPPHFNSDGSITITDSGLSNKGSKLSRNAPANSVLMVCIGATIGKVGINSIDVCFNQQINCVTTSDKFDAEFIYWQMRGKRFQNDVIQNAGQATLPIINKSKWQNLSIFLPDTLDEQIEIRKLLKKINIETENFINNKIQKIKNLNALKTAILKKALLQSEAA